MGKILAYSGLMEDKEVTWMPAYGPEQRGGTANVTVIVSDEKISSPILSKYDTAIILNQPSLEKFESRVKPGGIIIYDGYGIIHPPTRKDIKVYRIDAAAFATWLHAQGEAPSQHIAAWFTSQGVAWPPVLAVDADTVADWPGLVVLVKSRKKGTRWTEWEAAILRAEFARRGGWSREADGQPWVKNSSIQSDMATELGFSARSALDRHLGDGPDRGAAVMSSAVGALTGTR